MTLSTDVYVLDEVDRAEVFEFCQALLAKYDDRYGVHLQVSEDRDSWRGGDIRCLNNVVDQGLPAWLMLHYRVEGPLTTAEAAATHNEDCPEAEGDCVIFHETECWLSVDFDTAYGYRDKAGRGCGDLHALLVAELGQFLDGRGVRWRWRNEFTGEIHDGPERLVELVSGGFEASAWFRTSVLPAILASGGRPA